MVISFKGYRVKPYDIFVRAGYIYRHNQNDFIKEDHGGRFHVQRLEPSLYLIHYDLIIEKRHVVFELPFKLRTERQRINKFMYPYRVIRKQDAIKKAVDDYYALNIVKHAKKV